MEENRAEVDTILGLHERPEGEVNMERLLLCRHSYAQPPHTVPDRERQLTDMGVRIAQRAWNGILNRGVVPNLGLVSPYRRARQTMALLEQACSEKGIPSFEVHEWIGCCSDGDPKSALEHLAKLPVHTALVVGHQPFLGYLVLQATLKDVEFQPCDVVVLERNQAGWRLDAHLSESDFLESE